MTTVNRHSTEWPCPWCARFEPGLRTGFQTERGLRVHLRTCRSMPNHWNLLGWVPFFNEQLHIIGGCRNHPTSWASFHGAMSVFGIGATDSEEAFRLAELVIEYSSTGRLPATKSELLALARWTP